ncbi:MAG: carboxypeptidase regulatory-like domain-containing protein [Nitrospirae bacterium]|nr:carboxypeptidase regulatory-like domain-containing protein [Nitrospirota bacterium]
MKPVQSLLLSILIVVLTAVYSDAGWLIYHKPEFRGKVIDAESRQPIEGAVVVAVYNKETLGVGGGNMSSIIDVRETLTDKDGMFRIPSYTTFIQPFSWEISASFIIFKPEYGTFPKQHNYPPGLSLPDQEIFFSESIGTERSLKAYISGSYQNEILKTGIVELSKLKKREERLKAMPSPVSEISFKKQRLFIKLLNEENRNLGLEEYQIK